MELSWLEDFLAVIANGGFSRAATQRNVTQPALSRRIRALEAWIGTPLIDRGEHRLVLTPAGAQFQSAAEEIVRRLSLGRDTALEAARAASGTLRFAATHALSLTFFPAWLRGLEAHMPAAVPVQLVADNMVACERLMLQGHAHFLLCHAHPAAASPLVSQQFRSVHLGDDHLVPVSAPMVAGADAPRFRLPGTPATPVPALVFSAESGMGRILAAAHATMEERLWLEPSFASHVATILVAMAREGRGVAWAPMSLVAEDLATGRLVRAAPPDWDIPMEIRLVRPQARQNPAAEALWSLVATGAAQMKRDR
jgi:DNA-binding transcriptional LysR family regulator